MNAHEGVLSRTSMYQKAVVVLMCIPLLVCNGLKIIVTERRGGSYDPSWGWGGGGPFSFVERKCQSI